MDFVGGVIDRDYFTLAGDRVHFGLANFPVIAWGSQDKLDEHSIPLRLCDVIGWRGWLLLDTLANLPGSFRRSFSIPLEHEIRDLSGQTIEL